MEWFVRDRPTTSQGSYFVDGDAIRFKTVFSFGTDYRDGTTEPDIVIEYEGIVFEERIVLRSQNAEGKAFPEREYVFTPP